MSTLDLLSAVRLMDGTNGGPAGVTKVFHSKTLPPNYVFVLPLGS